MAKTVSIGMPADYQAESDARTMVEHARIMGDAKRKKAALGHLKKQQAAMQKAMAAGKGGTKDDADGDEAA